MMGVYAIVNTVNGKMYIGSAHNMESRWRGHLHESRHERHHSIKLQRAWAKYGEAAFVFQTIEIVKKVSLLRETEQRWIDFLGTYGPTIGYNSHPMATGGRSKGWHPSPATLEKLRIANARWKGCGNVNAKLDEDKVREICQRFANGESAREIARSLGLGETTIGNVVAGRTWKHVDAPRHKFPHKGASGQWHGHSKFKNDDVLAIRQRLKAGESRTAIAREYGVNPSTISRIATGKRWGHLEQE